MLRAPYFSAFRADTSSRKEPPKAGADPKVADDPAEGGVKDDSARVHSARAFEATRSARTKATHAHAAALHDKAAKAYGGHFMGREHQLMADYHAGGGC